MVKSVYYQDGSSTADAAKDPVIDLVVGGSNNRVGAKLVDLDPQWQLASQIWGLEMQLAKTPVCSAVSSSQRPSSTFYLVAKKVLSLAIGRQQLCSSQC